MTAEENELTGTEIAVIGVAGRFPGARTVEQYWTNLRDGVESVSPLTEEELRESGVAETLLQDPHYIRAGCFLENIDHFDAGFFGFSPMDAAIMDPQHRAILEVAWEALENAGYTPESFQEGGRGTIGVFGGSGMNAYMPYNLFTNPQIMESIGLFLVRHTGNDKDFLTTRVSYCLDLHGPSVNVQTACSTSLVAIHLAAQSLLSGECDMALAGGVTIELPHRRGYLYEEGEILSPDGHCRAFDAESKGTLFGSGCGVVALRRLEDAIEDRDHIWAVVRGSAINNDGSQKVGYLAPSVDGQARAIAEALAIAGVEPDTIGYIETHGTGTPVGDPIEVEAMTTAFRTGTERTGFCGIGSVKTNIGHLDTAAGIASFIKVTQALHHQQLPPTLNFTAPNPQIDFESSPFYINNTLKEWQTDGLRRAGVSSLGVGGTNAHVVLEEAPARTPSSEERRPYQIFTLSARSKDAVANATANLGEFLRDHDVDLADAAYTHQTARRAFPLRRAVVAADRDEAVELLTQNDIRKHPIREAAEEPSMVFLFPGGGAPYPGMAADVYAHEPVFRETVDRCLAHLEGKVDFDLRRVLFPTEETMDAAREELERPAVQIPALFITEYALAVLLETWGIRPDAMLGHSMGENTAACLAGTFTLEQALELVTLRGRLFEKVEGGGMLSVDLPREELEPLLPEGLSIAAENAPGLCVASGPVAAIDELEKRIEGTDAESRRIKISVAAHSELLDPILEEFGAYLRTMTLSPPQIPFVSNVTGTWITDEEATDPRYWMRHLRSTVRYSAGIDTLEEEKPRIFLEVGPGNVLGTLAKMHPAPSGGRHVLSSLRHRDEKVDDQRFLLQVVGDVWSAGYPVDFDAYHGDAQRLRLPLPTYPFEHQRYWIEPGESQAIERPSADTLSRLGRPEEWFFEPRWKLALTHAREEEGTHRWLVFLDDTGFGEMLVTQLRSAGHEVLTVREGDAFFQLEEHDFAIAPENREDYEQLVAALEKAEKLPDRVAHLWLVTREERFRPGSSFFHRNVERGFYSLLFFYQALGFERIEAGSRLAVFTSGMQSVNGEELPYPEKALALGPAMVIPREFPGVEAQAIDIEPADLSLGDELLEELTAVAPDRVVAFRDGERWVQTTEAVPRTGRGKPRLRKGGVYLLTGGFGGMGRVFAESLASDLQAHLVLVGRSPLPPRGEWDRWLAEQSPSDPVSRRIRNVRRLEGLGGEVEVVAADVANPGELEKMILGVIDRFGRIDGVFHAAGVIDDGLIPEKSLAGCERVFAPKIYGTKLLVDLVRKHAKPDFMMLFSSTSTLTGPAGQVDYVAANAFLNAYAHAESRGSDSWVVALDWGVWAQVGMAAEIGSAAKDDHASVVRTVDHPLLQCVIEESESKMVFSADYETSEQWTLDQHRTAEGQAIVPGTGYLEIFRAAAVEAGIAAPLSLEEVVFSSPLSVDDHAPRAIRVTVEKETGHSVVSLESLDAGDWLLHAKGRVRPEVETETTGAEKRDAIEPRLQGETWDAPGGYRTPQEEHLDFGPRWRNLRWARFGEGEALARIELDSNFTDDFATYPLHPAVLDLATGFAMPLVDGYNPSGGLYVPMSYGRVEFLAPLTGRVFSHVRGGTVGAADTVTFDVTITDESGNRLVEVSDFTIKRFGVSAHFGRGGDRRNMSPDEAFFRQSLALGITPAEGFEALRRVLAGGAVPQVVVSSLDPNVLVACTDSLASQKEDSGGGARFARPELESNYVEPRNGVERNLVTIWEELLGVDQVGVEDSFFDLGGYSLLAVRLFGRIKKEYEIEYPISILFEVATVAELAERIIADGGASADDGADDAGEAKAATPAADRPRFEHLVCLQKGDASKPPFFLIAGMFGNIMNLRHLASHFPADQPYYAVQARGLLGDQIPHTRFEEMAQAYLAEMKQVQPEGPYYIGGFSGGGVTAYEMAQQLESAGETVGLLVMLDTPAPDQPSGLGMVDKMVLQWQNLKQHGVQSWMDILRRRLSKSEKGDDNAAGADPAEFRSELVGEAFLEALRHYRVPPYDGVVHLFRPEPVVVYQLPGGKRLTWDRTHIDDLNHWGPHVKGIIKTHVVPGDHDSMVLEPNVRVLGSVLRRILIEAQREHAAKAPAEATV